MKGFQRNYLVKKSHNLKPVINIGKHGPTEAVITAVAEALDHHELIKVKFQDFKKQRQKIAEDLAEAVSCELIKVIGNIAILYLAKKKKDERKYHLPSGAGKE